MIRVCGPALIVGAGQLDAWEIYKQNKTLGFLVEKKSKFGCFITPVDVRWISYVKKDAWFRLQNILSSPNSLKMWTQTKSLSQCI